MCRQWKRSSVVGTALPCGDRRELGSRRVTRVFVIVVSRALIDTCQTRQGSYIFQVRLLLHFLRRLPLPFPSTVQSSVDPLSVNDLWTSAVAVRPVQQQHQTQMPFWPHLQGTEFWPQTGQPQQWSTPRSPLGLTGPPPTTLQGMSANNWQSPLPPPPTWDANAPGFGSGDGGRQDASWTGWNASGKGYKGNGMPFMEISDRDPIPKWDFLEPGARLRPWLRELSFWRHQFPSVSFLFHAGRVDFDDPARTSSCSLPFPTDSRSRSNPAYSHLLTYRLCDEGALGATKFDAIMLFLLRHSLGH